MEIKNPPQESMEDSKKSYKSSSNFGLNHTCSKNNRKKKQTKLIYMLSHFVKGEHINTFQAKDLGDTCLHTTVSDIYLKFGIRLCRKSVKVKNSFGGFANVNEYWLAANDVPQILQILESYREAA